MSAPISCVMLVPAKHRATINELTASMGYGDDNLSVELVKPNGRIWWGCHWWVDLEFLQAMADPENASEAMASMVVSVAESGTASGNWSSTLEANDLTLKNNEDVEAESEAEDPAESPVEE